MERYSRQTLFQEIGKNGQKKLLKSQVTIIGCGALGSCIANNLARAGIGDILIVDRDFLELSNLQRQALFHEGDLKKPKALLAQEKISEINSEIKISGVVDDVNYKNVEEFVRGRDLVLDGTDNMETRFLINDVCRKHHIPWIYGGVVSSYGMTANILPE